MVDRINLILKAKNLTSRQFAEEIGIQPSGMSHILSGRNRPSLDFVMKVINRYPEIDIKWLTLGEGEMYSTTVPVHSNKPYSQTDLFSIVEDEPSAIEDASDEPPAVPAPEEQEQETEIDDSFITPDNDEQEAEEISTPAEPTRGPVSVAASVPAPETPSVPAQAPANDPLQPASDDASAAEHGNNNRKKIVKLVILYDDHTFAEYFPE